MSKKCNWPISSNTYLKSGLETEVKYSQSCSQHTESKSVLPTAGDETHSKLTWCGGFRNTAQDIREKKKEPCNEVEHLPLCPSILVGEKRKPSEPLPHEENKRPKVVGDIPMDLINEVMSTIADPAAIPEVSSHPSVRISQRH